MEDIGAGAFAGCEGMELVFAWSSVSCKSDSFANTGLRAVLVGERDSTSGWRLPGGVKIYRRGAETGFGAVESCVALDGTIYLVTKEGNAVVVALSDQQTSLTLPATVKWASSNYDVVWIAEGADAGVRRGTTVELPPNCRFDYSLCQSRGGAIAGWTAAYDDTAADFWITACDVCDAMNAVRPSNAPAIQPDTVLMDAASILAQEEYNGETRPDGRDWDTALDDAGLGEYTYVYCLYGLIDYQNMKDILTERFAPAIDDEERPQYKGEYYSRLGIARYYDYGAGSYNWQIFLLVP